MQFYSVASRIKVKMQLESHDFIPGPQRTFFYPQKPTQSSASFSACLTLLFCKAIQPMEKTGKTQFVLFDRMQFVLIVCSMDEAIVCSTRLQFVLQKNNRFSLFYVKIGDIEQTKPRRTNLTYSLEYVLSVDLVCSTNHRGYRTN